MPKWRTPRGPQLRFCAKLALAAVAAYALTLGGRNEYALFSVLGATLVMGASVGEDLNTSRNRILGTLAGAIVGAAVAYTLGKSIWSLGIAVAALAWLTVGLGWGVAALRVAIAMALVALFTHVDDAGQYGAWRMLNTLIGVCIGVAVSRLIWPIRGRDEIASAIDKTTAAITKTLDAMGRDASSDTLLPLEVELLDALAVIRTARKNAQRGQSLDRYAEHLNEQTRLAVVAAIATLGASLKLDQLAQAGARAECLWAVRHVIAPLAAHADVTSGEQLVNDFAARHDAAMREAAHPDLDAGARALLAGLLSELQQIRTALVAMRDSDGRAATR
jgi:uncharacterized membrane protein YccC